MAHHEGGCQCGRVRFSVDVELGKTISCNCSRCGKLGSILAFAGEDAFDLKSGEGDLTEYQFNTHKISHFFCSTCGIQSFGRGVAPNGQAMVAVNVRCLDDVDAFALQPQQVDGKSF